MDTDRRGWPPRLSFRGARRIPRRFCTRNNYSQSFESAPKNVTRRLSVTKKSQRKKLAPHWLPNILNGWEWQIILKTPNTRRWHQHHSTRTEQRKQKKEKKEKRGSCKSQEGRRRSTAETCALERQRKQQIPIKRSIREDEWMRVSMSILHSVYLLESRNMWWLLSIGRCAALIVTFVSFCLVAPLLLFRHLFHFCLFFLFCLDHWTLFAFAIDSEQ